MAIKIIQEPDIYLTQEEYDRLSREWTAANSYTTAPVSFETFVRRYKEKTQ